jgi:hypothetical protein
MSPSPHLETETYPISEMLPYLEFPSIRWAKSMNSVILSTYNLTAHKTLDVTFIRVEQGKKIADDIFDE